ncbi:Rv3235 family protein [Amycolatopsis sp. NPDC059021]|uniref:Rv3235 family protein n=1 Tax=Amycolatopsis sp. NPDC059021 TaxID=3346704 RepID=UPI00366F0E16
MTTAHRLKTLTGYEPHRAGRSIAAGSPAPLPAGRSLAAVRDVSPALDGPQVAILLTAILETYDGHRTTAQVEPLVDRPLLERLRAHSRARSAARHRLRSVRLCAPADDVVEACARVETGRRTIALAARFERTGGRWRCVRFDLLDPLATAQRMAA